MAYGPGEHDDLLTAALDAAARRAGDERWAHDGGVSELDNKSRIHGGILIVFGDRPHSGFCCQATAEMTARLPQVLRGVAHDIERDMRASGLPPSPHTTLGDELPREMARVRDEVMPSYLAIGDAGKPALFLMRVALDDAARSAVAADLDGHACGLQGIERLHHVTLRIIDDKGAIAIGLVRGPLLDRLLAGERVCLPVLVDANGLRHPHVCLFVRDDNDGLIRAANEYFHGGMLPGADFVHVDREIE